ncbi:hypothetical protein KAR91_27260 [Candidatus Pacearchaeota archaeon]|nr:hypothetical protein [Candidatus Pacearchaeota archaeon]
MAKYCVNKQTKNPGGNHEVHKKGCQWWPSDENRIDLGECADCHEAVQKAIALKIPNVDGCKDCCPDCNTDKS